MARDETGKRHGRGGNVGRMARDERGKRHGRGGNVGRMARDETGQRHGRGGNVGRMARDETGKRHGRVRKRRADGARRNGKTGTGGAETSGGWRATKRENGTGGCGNVGRMARDETGKLARAGRKPQARRREDRC